jgi:hypothetical protein
MDSVIEHHKSGGVSFVGDEAVDVFRAMAIASALKLYAKTGIRANRAYTPKAMMSAASKITGKPFKPRAYLEAADALTAFAEAKRARIKEVIR